MSTQRKEQSDIHSDSPQADTTSTRTDNPTPEGHLFSLADNEQQPFALDINRKLDGIETDIKTVTDQFAQSYDRLDSSLGQLDQHQHDLRTELANLFTQVKENHEQQEQSDQGFNARLHDYADRFTYELKQANGLLAHQKNQLEALQDKQSTLHQWQNQLKGQNDAHDARIEQLDKALTEKFQIAHTQYETLNNLHREQRSDFESLAQSHRSLNSHMGDMGREFGKALKQQGLKHKALVTKFDSHSEQIEDILSDVTTLHQQTRRGWRWTAAGLATVTALVAGLFIYVQFFPMPGTSALSASVAELDTTVDNLGATLVNETSALQSGMTELDARLSGTENAQQTITLDLGTLQGALANQQGALSTLNDQIAALELSVNGPEIQAPAPVLSIADGQWVAQQPDGNYTVQLLGSYQEGYLPIFINQNADELQGEPLSTNISTHRGRDWHNLYYGSFSSFDAALSALQALPPRLQQNGPWIRSFASTRTTPQ